MESEGEKEPQLFSESPVSPQLLYSCLPLLVTDYSLHLCSMSSCRVCCAVLSRTYLCLICG
eukprot:COSAG05_NODE_561_length_8675_cov_3.694846_1_plen_61_part_00